MRRLLTALGCLALAACGGAPNSFSEPVKGRQAEVYAALSGLHGGLTPQLMSLPPIVRSTPEEGTVRYLLRSAEGEGEGTVTFEVEAAGESESRVSVEVELPAVEADIGGTRKELSEAKAASQIRKAIREWAAMRASGKPTSDKLAAIDNQLGFMLLALSPRKTKEAIRLVQSGAAASEFAETYLAWNGDLALEEASGGFASDGEAADEAPSDNDDSGWGAQSGADAPRKETRKGKSREDDNHPTDDWGA